MGVLVPLTIILPVFIAIIRYHKLPSECRILFYYLIMAGLINTVASMMARNGIRNLPLSHLLTMLEFVMLTDYFSIVLKEKKAIRILQVCFIIACILNTIFLQDIWQFNTYTRSLEALIIMLLSVNLFAKMFTDIDGPRLVTRSDFWFNTGMFLYFSGSFMMFIFSNFLLQASKKDWIIIWNIHATFLLIMYILFTIGFIKCKK